MKKYIILALAALVLGGCATTSQHISKEEQLEMICNLYSLSADQKKHCGDYKKTCSQNSLSVDKKLGCGKLMFKIACDLNSSGVAQKKLCHELKLEKECNQDSPSPDQIQRCKELRLAIACDQNSPTKTQIRHCEALRLESACSQNSSNAAQRELCQKQKMACSLKSPATAQEKLCKKLGMACDLNSLVTIKDELCEKLKIGCDPDWPATAQKGLCEVGKIVCDMNLPDNARGQSCEELKLEIACNQNYTEDKRLVFDAILHSTDTDFVEAEPDSGIIRTTVDTTDPLDKLAHGISTIQKEHMTFIVLRRGDMSKVRIMGYRKFQNPIFWGTYVEPTKDVLTPEMCFKMHEDIRKGLRHLSSKKLVKDPG